MKQKANLTYWAIVFSIFFYACNHKGSDVPYINEQFNFEGYNCQLSYVNDTVNYTAQVDSVFRLIYHTFSIHSDKSVVSRINQFSRSDSLFRFKDDQGVFIGLFDDAKQTWRKTDGYYDPTTRPLYRAWAGIRAGISQGEPNLDSLFEFVGFDDSNFDLLEMQDGNRYFESQIRKGDRRGELDFGKVILAYALDYSGAFLSEMNVKNYRLKIDNLAKSSGILSDSLSQVEIQLPDTLGTIKIDFLRAALAVKRKEDKATLIDPSYGYPVENNVECVVVIAPTAALAEMYAQAFMIMGTDEAQRFYEQNPEELIETLIVYKEDGELKSASTDGFDGRIIHSDELLETE